MAPAATRPPDDEAKRRGSRRARTPPAAAGSGKTEKMKPTTVRTERPVHDASKVTPPDWFVEAVDAPVESLRVRVEPGVAVHCLRWGASASKRGVVLVHGGGASAVWWRFVAPFFQDDLDVVAVSQSGCGESDFKEKYSVEDWGSEISAVCDALGFFAPDRPKPYIVAHSMGGAVAHCHLVREAESAPDRDSKFGGFVMIDTAIRNPETARLVKERVLEMRRGDPTMEIRPGWPRNPDSVTPLERFKLRPYQACDQIYLLKFIAEGSVVRFPDRTWSWRGDANRDAKLDWDFPDLHDENLAVVAERMPVAWIYGEQSVLCDASVVEHARKSLAGRIGVVAVPRCGHHVWLDNPLAVVTAIRGVFAGWASIPFKDGPGVVDDEDDRLNRLAKLESKL